LYKIVTKPASVIFAIVTLIGFVPFGY